MPRGCDARRRAVVLTSYRSGAASGPPLGAAGYSYDVLARLFAPLLAGWGEVIPVERDGQAVDSAVDEARHRGLDPIHVSFLPCQDAVFASSAANVLVPMWAFPDVPDEAFDGNPQNNWVATLNRCRLVLVGGQFTADSFHRAGVCTPIRVVPAPTPSEYLAVPPWSAEPTIRLACSAYVFPNPDVPAEELWDAPEQASTTVSQASETAPATLFQTMMPPLLARTIRFLTARLRTDRWRSYLRRCRRSSVELSGLVYTCFLNPRHLRENWPDLLSAFVFAFRDCPEATLVIKLVTVERDSVDRVLDFYRHVGLSHRCKIVFITDYLSQEQMLALTRASTYYVTATRAEGVCLPLRNYLAAGRPAIAPRHSALSDYIDDDVGLTVPWHAEPAAWPQDQRVRFKTTWARLDWPAFVARLRQSRILALGDRHAYEARANLARHRFQDRSSMDRVREQLHTALECVDRFRSQGGRAA